MQNEKKHLPFGTWLYIANLAPETTEETLTQFLYERGIAVTPECISLKTHRRGSLHTSAIVAIPPSAMVYLFNWAVNGDKLDGVSIVAEACNLPSKFRAA